MSQPLLADEQPPQIDWAGGTPFGVYIASVRFWVTLPTDIDIHRLRAAIDTQLAIVRKQLIRQAQHRV